MRHCVSDYSALSEMTGQSTSRMARSRWHVTLSVALAAVAAGGAVASTGCSSTPVSGTEAAAPKSDDYLTADLRREVEALKRDAAREPTTHQTIGARTDVLWRWVNAYALTGGPVPVNLPLEVSVIRWGLADGRGPGETIVEDMDFFTLTRLASIVDGYVREFTIKDESPDALGALTIDPAGPLQAGSRATLRVTYTVGSVPMQPGGALLIGTQYMGDQGREQLEDPAADDYVSIASSNPEARFEPIKVPLSGLH